MWDLVPQSGIEPRSPILGAQSLSHWTTRDHKGFFFSTSLPTLPFLVFLITAILTDVRQYFTLVLHFPDLGL